MSFINSFKEKACYNLQLIWDAKKNNQVANITNKDQTDLPKLQESALCKPNISCLLGLPFKQRFNPTSALL